MSGAAPARPDRAARLLRPARLSRRRPVLGAALAAALLLHMVAAIGVVTGVPGLMRQGAAPAPREAQVELVRNDQPATGDAPIGASRPGAQGAAARPQRAPAVPRNRDDAAPPVPQAGAAAQGARPAAPDGAPQVRLSADDPTEGMTGGSAEEQAAPDPKAPNRLPAYPAEAGRLGQFGTVEGVVQVRPDGTVAAVVVVRSSGYPALDSAAVRAWQTWRFRPGLDHGTPAASRVPVELNFRLKD